MQLNYSNWFWCDTCEKVSYDYNCECRSTSCNCGGCVKCDPLYELVQEAKKNGTALTPEEAKAMNLQKWGSIETPEQKLLKEIFE